MFLFFPPNLAALIKETIFEDKAVFVWLNYRAKIV